MCVINAPPINAVNVNDTKLIKDGSRFILDINFCLILKREKKLAQAGSMNPICVKHLS